MTPEAATATTGITWADLRQEPYRLLFPLGMGFIAIGLGIWIPFYFRPQTFPYPGPAHAALQIQGFVLCFIFGFLCTMLPKVLGVAPLGPGQFALFPILLIATPLATVIGATAWGQIFHLLLLVNFVLFIATRWKHRRGNPPAAFAFIALAVSADMIGTLLRLLAGGLGGFALARTGSLLQFQAFPLLLILGIGNFLLPKLFGNALVQPEDLRSSPNTSFRTLLPWGFLFALSYALDGWVATPLALRVAAGLRAGIWFWFLLRPLHLHHLHRLSRRLPAYLAGARYSLLAMGLGLAMPVFLPAYPVAWEHVIFITGFLWLILSIAARVTAAHGGRLEILQNHRKQTFGYGWLLLLAMSSRVATDIWTRGHWLHLAVAAGFALGAVAWWAWIYAPLLLVLPERK